jgi:hypothetical protein
MSNVPGITLAHFGLHVRDLERMEHLDTPKD